MEFIDDTNNMISLLLIIADDDNDTLSLPFVPCTCFSHDTTHSDMHIYNEYTYRNV
jgi:hypothetical protein